MNESATIVAVATAPGPAGIAVIRMSGPDSVEIASRLFIPRNKKELLFVASHKACFGQVVDPDSGFVLDSGLVTLMRAPRSYTGEDVAEISCHGSPALCDDILSLCCRMGARPALPGEFTRRALENGRMDLSQAEAVLDLVNARTTAAARAATEKMEGSLSRKVASISRDISDVLSRVEASLDFPGEAPEPQAESLAREIRKMGIEPIEALTALYEDGEVLRRGTYTAIVGRPNAGKSSLLNALLGRDRALVSEISGTTRDIVEEETIIHGKLFVLADTAGLSSSPDRLEALGMERSRRALEKAGIVLFVVDSCDLSGQEDAQLASGARDAPVLVLANKADVASPGELGKVRERFSGKRVLAVSALTGENLDLLMEAMASMSPQPAPVPESPNARQKQALEQAGRMLARACENAMAQCWELSAEDIRSSLESLGEIHGKNLSEAVLDRIFSNFCIGK